jgi:PAS domain S-box-containing protein
VTKSFGIAGKLSLAITILVTVSLGTMSLLAIVASRRSLREQVQSANLTAATLAARAVEQYIADAESIMREAPGRPKLSREIRSANWPETAAVLENFLRSFSQFDYVAVQDSRGILRVRVPDAETVGQDFSFRDFFQEATRTRNLYISGVYVSRAARRPVVSIAVPVLDGPGEVKGVIVGALALGRLSEFISTVGHEGELVYVVDAKGRLIAQSGSRGPRPGTEVSGLPIVQAVLAGRSGSMEFDEPAGGERFLGAHVPIPRLGWGVVAAQPVSVAYAVGDRLGRWLLWISVGFAAGAVALGWGLARTLTGPLLRLVEATENLGAGDFSVRVAPEGRDEAAALATAFNRMAEQLQGSYQRLEQTTREVAALNEQLEQRVDERTRQLETANQELSELQSYTRGLIESNIDAIVTIDPRGSVTDVNRQMCEITGRTREELIGTQFKDHVTDPQRAEEGVRQTLAEGRVTNYELAIRGRGGRPTVVSYNATTFTGTDGRLRGVFAAARDITDQKRLEERLRRKNQELEEQNRLVQEANRLKSEFLANMSHELRTPLNAIIGFSELMHDGKVGAVSTEQKEFLGDILTSARHLLQLINDVLDLSKVESGKMEFRPVPVDLPIVVGEVRDILRALAATKHIQVDVQIEETLTGITTDPGKLKQVLYNYLSNALKFTPDDGRVTIRVGPDGPADFRLDVEDTGIGIRGEDLGRLFVEFQQLDASTVKRHAGTGLGLALTKRIVEAQGGRVGVHSTPGRGSTFFAVLPRVAAVVPGAEAEPDAAGRPAPTAGSPVLLVIEDDALDRKWLERTLTAAGFAVETAATGAAGIERARKRAYDAITLDMLLPDIAGREVLRTIRSDGPNRDTPIIVVSVVAEQGLGAGFRVHDVIGKPVDRRQLIASLERAGVARDRSRPILVVDDNPRDLKLVARALKELGYRPVCCSDGESGLRAAEGEPPAALVLDLVMPGMDGLEFLVRFRRLPALDRTPVILWTARDLTAAERGRLLASAEALVHKSQGPAALLDEIRAHVAVPATSPDRREGPNGR